MAFDATNFYGWPAGSITRLPSISGWIHPVCALRHKPPSAERPPHVWMYMDLRRLLPRTTSAQADGQDTKIGVLLDTETTGLDQAIRRLKAKPRKGGAQ